MEEKKGSNLKARKLIGGNKQCDYITTKEDASSTMVSAEAVMLTCVIDALEERSIAVVDISKTFVQMLVEDKNNPVIVHIRGPLVDILAIIAPDVFGQYVWFDKSGQKGLLVQCLNALYGTMVAALLRSFSRV